MKEIYEKPAIVIEEYKLDTAIAAGCSTKVSLGPIESYDTETGTMHSICEEYEEEDFGSILNYASSTDGCGEVSGPFFEGSCSCYLSSGGSSLITS